MKLLLVAWILSLAACGTSPAAEPNPDVRETPVNESSSGAQADEWTVEITTSGGITGKGLGKIVVHSDGSASFNGTACAVAEEEFNVVQRALASANPASWKQRYIYKTNPHGNADQIEYVLSLRQIDGGKVLASTSAWFDGSGDLAPADLRDLYEAIWNLRQSCSTTTTGTQ